MNQDRFAMICFLVLMQNGKGLLDKSPDYIAEKTAMLSSGIDAFSYLDINNMRMVIAWCNLWKFEIPDAVLKEMAAQDAAELELFARGYDLR